MHRTRSGGTEARHTVRAHRERNQGVAEREEWISAAPDGLVTGALPELASPGPPSWRAPGRPRARTPEGEPCAPRRHTVHPVLGTTTRQRLNSSGRGGTVGIPPAGPGSRVETGRDVVQWPGRSDPAATAAAGPTRVPGDTTTVSWPPNGVTCVRDQRTQPGHGGSIASGNELITNRESSSLPRAASEEAVLVDHLGVDELTPTTGTGASSGVVSAGSGSPAAGGPPAAGRLPPPRHPCWGGRRRRPGPPR